MSKIKVGSFVEAKAWTGDWSECIVYRILDRGLSYSVMDTKTGGCHTTYLVSKLDKPDATVVAQKRSDDYDFRIVSWREGGKDRVILRAGCRTAKSVKAALNRWKPEYRLEDYMGRDNKAHRRKLNAESRSIVKALAKEAGLKLPKPSTTSETKRIAKKSRSSLRSAASSRQPRRLAKSKSRKASSRKA